MISAIVKAYLMKLCTVIVLLEAYQNIKRNFQKSDLWCHTSILKAMGNSDLRETRQIMYHSKGNDKSFPKM